MSDKSEFLEIFGMRMSALGYSHVRNNIYQKEGAGFLYQINCGFVGKVAILCNLTFGFLIKEVEALAGKHAVVQQQRAAGAKYLPTIFASLDVIGEFCGLKISPSIDLDRDVETQIQAAEQAIATIECKVSSLSDIACLTTTIKNLPIGHHAFRIPILLSSLGDREGYELYIKNVKSKNFVSNYDEFLGHNSYGTHRKILM